MNNTQNLVNNEDNTILQQKNYPSAISESEKMCSSDGYKTLWKYRGIKEGEIMENPKSAPVIKGTGKLRKRIAYK